MTAVRWRSRSMRGLINFSTALSGSATSSNRERISFHSLGVMPTAMREQIS
jgi:hypothetical protein